MISSPSVITSQSSGSDLLGEKSTQCDAFVLISQLDEGDGKHTSHHHFTHAAAALEQTSTPQLSSFYFSLHDGMRFLFLANLHRKV